MMKNLCYSPSQCIIGKCAENEAFRSPRVNGATYLALLNGSQKGAV